VEVQGMFKYIVVFDEALIRKTIMKKIIALDMNLSYVGEAGDVQEAICVIEQEEPDIIITDIRLPVMNGVQYLKKLYTDYPFIKIIVISGYSDFEYTREAIEANVVGYILKPFERKEIKDMLATAITLLQSQRQQQDEQDLKQYHLDIQNLYNTIVSPQNADNVLFHSPRLQFTKEPLSFCLIVVNGAQGQLLQHMHVQLSLSSENYIPLTSLIHPHETILFVFENDFNSFKLHSLYTIMNNILSTLHSANNPMLAGISEIKTTTADLHTAYNEAVQALNMHNIHDTSNVFVYSPTPNNLVPETNWKNTHSLLFFIESGNIAKVEEYISDLFAFLEKEVYVSLMHIKIQCLKIMTDIQVMAENYGIANFGFHNYTSQMNICYHPQSIRETFSNMVKSTARIFSSNNDPSNDLIQTIKKYIDITYQQPLTLESIASLFYIHPVYCSTLFKEKTGENFQDYLRNVRIAHAKQMLRDTPQDIKRISKLIGYNNTKYFYRVFKKTVGVTPSEFRNLSLSNSP
jgi:two-component system, response regulator YesN